MNINQDIPSVEELSKTRSGFSKSGLPISRAQLFHKHEWQWVNKNKKTNMEFFYGVLQQRLNDGFVVVNRYQGTNDFFHLVKVLEARKNPYKGGYTGGKGKKYKRTASGIRSNYSEEKMFGQNDEVMKNEKVDIVLQFLIYFDKQGSKKSKRDKKNLGSTAVEADEGVSVIKTELYVE